MKTEIHVSLDIVSGPRMPRQEIRGARSALVVTVTSDGGPNDPGDVSFLQAAGGNDVCNMVAHMLAYVRDNYGADVMAKVIAGASTVEPTPTMILPTVGLVH